MSKITKEINKISLTVIGVSGRIVFYTAVAVLLIVGARSGYQFGHSIFYAPGVEAEPGRDLEITLTGKESVGQVGELLEKAGLIRDENAFAIQAFCYEYEVKEGTYVLNTSQSSKELIDILDEGVQEEKK